MTLMVKDLSLNGAKLYEAMEHETQYATRLTSLLPPFSPSPPVQAVNPSISTTVVMVSTSALKTEQKKKRWKTNLFFVSFVRHSSVTAITSNYFQHEKLGYQITEKHNKTNSLRFKIHERVIIRVIIITAL